MTPRSAVLVVACVALAGCATEEASARNFVLEPMAIGWFAGEEAHFRLNITPSFSREDPRFEVDRQFAIEEIRLSETGPRFGGDHKTRDPDDVGLRLERGGVEGDSFVLDAERPGLDLFLTLPEDLRDSSYVLEIKLFKVGWIKSGEFRVDRRN